jgi:hypothetical protein
MQESSVAVDEDDEESEEERMPSASDVDSDHEDEQKAQKRRALQQKYSGKRVGVRYPKSQDSQPIFKGLILHRSTLSHNWIDALLSLCLAGDGNRCEAFKIDGVCSSLSLR